MFTYYKYRERRCSEQERERETGEQSKDKDVVHPFDVKKRITSGGCIEVGG